MSGIVVAGTHSGCGKTTVTLGLMAALGKMGLTVQPFKTGPDFIDTGLHKLVTGRHSRNLDLWMCGEDYARNCFRRYSADSDIAVVEGVMGLYDGNLNTASLARCLDVSVVLVVDAYGMAETAGAIVKGLKDMTVKGMNAAPRFAGVIFNRVASQNHYKRLKESVADMPVLGYLPRDLDFEIPHRHLGLVTAEDNPLTQENIDRLADAIIHHIDVGLIMRKYSASDEGPQEQNHLMISPVRSPAPCRIAVARDRAFCFYYEDNLDRLREAGAQLVNFSPLADAELPVGIDGIYIGGGYPELHAAQLSGNISMLRAIKGWAEAGRPIYAECGGLMYLSKGIRQNGDKRYEMSDVFPFETVMKKGRSRLGYREIILKSDCILGSGGTAARGHEFHYSEIAEGIGENPGFAYQVMDGSGNVLPDEGYSTKKTVASYVHLHFGSNPAIAEAFVNSCASGAPGT